MSADKISPRTRFPLILPLIALVAFAVGVLVATGLNQPADHGGAEHQASTPPPITANHLPRVSLPPLASVQAATHQASNSAVTATSIFPGPDGLVGAVVHASDDSKQRNIIWFTPNLKAVVVNGHLVSAEGADLTQEARYVHGLLIRPRDALVEASRPETKSITIGTAGPIITAFFDPNCIYCHMLYAKLLPMVGAGKLRLRMVLVGVIKPSSEPRSSSILMAPDPAAAMATNERDFDVKHEEGGMPVANPEANTAPAKAMEKNRHVVQSNTELLFRTGATGTPALLYCSRSTHAARLMPGMPADVQELLDDAAPLSHCKS